MRVARVVRLGEVAARVRLAEQLAPELLGAQDLREPAGLLLRRAAGEQRRPDEVHADAADQLRRPGAGELLGDDVVADRAGVAPAVLLGPGDADPPAGRELGLPLPPERDLVGEVVEAGREALAVLPRQVLAQPRAALVAQRALGLGR